MLVYDQDISSDKWILDNDRINRFSCSVMRNDNELIPADAEGGATTLTERDALVNLGGGMGECGQVKLW